MSRSYRVRIRLAGAPAVDAGPLRTGMTMDANLIVSRRENAMLVPSRALKGSAIWVMEDGRVNKREVRKGVTGSERTEMKSPGSPKARWSCCRRRVAARRATRPGGAGGGVGVRHVSEALKRWPSRSTSHWLT